MEDLTFIKISIGLYYSIPFIYFHYFYYYSYLNLYDHFMLNI
jgi:hypothetical protein